jgi:hypothetical protein
VSAAHLEIVAKGRSALLAGEVDREVPPNIVALVA